MQTLFIHLSALVGLLAFVNQLVRYAPMDRTIFVGVGSGMAVYVVLMIGEVVVRRIVESGSGEEAGVSTKESSGLAGSEQSHKNHTSAEPSAQAA